MSSEIRLIATLVFVVALVVGYVGYRLLCKSHRENPEWVKNQKRREEEAQRELSRQSSEISELDNIAMDVYDEEDI